MVALIVLIVDLFILKMPLGVFIATLSWLICSWVISWWQKKIYVLSVKILQYKEDAFEWAYNSHNLFIEDCYGNVYDKFRQAEKEKAAYQRLLNIIKIGSGSEDVDKARINFAVCIINIIQKQPVHCFLCLRRNDFIFVR